MKTKTFKSELARLMRITKRRLVASGTVGMSQANFKQCTPTPSHTLDGAPAGIAGYDSMFNDLCDGKQWLDF